MTTGKGWHALPHALLSLFLLQCLPLPSPYTFHGSKFSSVSLDSGRGFNTFSFGVAEARQAQCRLEASAKQPDPAEPFPSSSPSGQNNTDGGGSGNGTVVLSNFTYGVDTIRGVNM